MRQDRPPETQLEFLEELRRIAEWGLGFTKDPFDIERYERLLELAAIQYAELSGVAPQHLTERFRAELGGCVTPKVGLDAAVFDEQGRILVIRRHDDGLWALPGGWAELGERPEAGAVREVWEETGLRVEVRELLSVVSRLPGEYGDNPHTSVHILYYCEAVGGALAPSPEAPVLGFWDIDALEGWHREHEQLARRGHAHWRKHRGSGEGA